MVVGIDLTEMGSLFQMVRSLFVTFHQVELMLLEKRHFSLSTKSKEFQARIQQVCSLTKFVTYTHQECPQIIKYHKILSLIKEVEYTHFYATNDDVYNHNKCCLRSLFFPIAHSVIARVRNNSSTKEYEEQFEVDMIILVGAMASGGDFRGL